MKTTGWLASGPLLIVTAMAVVAVGCGAPTPQPHGRPLQPRPTMERPAVDLRAAEPRAEAEVGEWEAAEPTTERLPTAAVGANLDTIYFDFDRSEIRPDQRPTMQANADWLRDHPDTRILIGGHCDERGTREYNLALGERRARSAREYLVSLGIAPGRLDTISYGEEQPADPAHNEAAWARNRRATFTIVDGF